MAESSGAKWSEPEIAAMLSIISELNIINLLDGKHQRNKSAFVGVQTKMTELGFSRTWLQIRAKWKALKSKYLNEKRRRERSGCGGGPTPKYYTELDEILATRPLANVLVDGIESGTEERIGSPTELFNSMMEPQECDQPEVETCPEDPQPCDDPQPGTSGTSSGASSDVGAPPAPRYVPSIRKRVRLNARTSQDQAAAEHFEKLGKLMQNFQDEELKFQQKQLEQQAAWESRFIQSNRESTQQLLGGFTNLLAPLVQHACIQMQQPHNLMPPPMGMPYFLPNPFLHQASPQCTSSTQQSCRSPSPIPEDHSSE